MRLACAHPRQAADQLGISHYTIEAWLSKKKLQRTKDGRRTMILESELEKVLDDGGSPQPRSGGYSEAGYEVQSENHGRPDFLVLYQNCGHCSQWVDFFGN